MIHFDEVRILDVSQANHRPMASWMIYLQHNGSHDKWKCDESWKPVWEPFDHSQSNQKSLVRCQKNIEANFQGSQKKGRLSHAQVKQRLDYIDISLNINDVSSFVKGCCHACKKVNCVLLGGETAEMPDTYLPGEHDLVGIITGIVDKEKIITGENISPGDILIGLPSNGLHTNGYSLARKIFFESEKYSVDTYIDSLKSTVGEALLKPHINYTNHVFKVLEKNIEIKGVAHITGGGLTENIPRILPDNCSVKIKKDTWPKLELFSVLQNLGFTFLCDSSFEEKSKLNKPTVSAHEEKKPIKCNICNASFSAKLPWKCTLIQFM